jgi:hypothetical protein
LATEPGVQDHSGGVEVNGQSTATLHSDHFREAINALIRVSILWGLEKSGGHAARMIVPEQNRRLTTVY